MATFIGTDANNNITYQVEPDAKKTMLPNTGVAKFQDEIAQILETVTTYKGQPVVVTSAEDMTEETVIYLYMGEEEGYNADHWYYYDTENETWTDGGAYVANPVIIDDTLTQAGEAADAKATGDELTQIKSDFDELDDYLITDVTTIPGNNLIAGWEQGDINTTTGADVATSSYWRTGYIPVTDNAGFITVLSKDAENTVKSSAWSSTSYGLVYCYSDDSYLGLGTNASGVVTYQTGTTKVRIGHILPAHYPTLALYRNRYTYPSGHEDIEAETFDTSKISDVKIQKNQLSFLGLSSVCVADKSLFSPWFIVGNNIQSSIISFKPGTYSVAATGTNVQSVYIYCFDDEINLINQITINNLVTNAFSIPENTKYISVAIYMTNGTLVSKLTSINIYHRNVSVWGTDSIEHVIDVDALPTLPPLALTGQACGGILSLGHGGQSTLYAEDSIESFYGLARSGFGGSEVDIQFTKDHIPVCWHNSTLSTLEGGTSNDHIYDYTLAELDENFDFRTWWNVDGNLRSTVARFEEVCILARAYGWTIIPDKMISAEGAEEADMAVIVAMLKKYKLDNQLILYRGFTGLTAAFPNAPIALTAMEAPMDDAWFNAMIESTIPGKYHEVDGNYVVNDDVDLYTMFNWLTVKRDGGLEDCIDTNATCAKHNVKLIWYTVESPEDIYQLVANCPDTAIVLTGLYTIPDGVNEYLGISWSNRKYGLNKNIVV